MKTSIELEKLRVKENLANFQLFFLIRGREKTFTFFILFIKKFL